MPAAIGAIIAVGLNISAAAGTIIGPPTIAGVVVNPRPLEGASKS